MAIAFDKTSESHTGTTLSTSEASFSWVHPSIMATPAGVLVYTFTNADADDATAVSYGGASLAAVSGGRAVDTTGEPGDCKAWFLGSGVPALDPTNWMAGSNAGTSQIYDVEYGNGYWVTVAGAGQIRYTTDPSGSWSTPTSVGFSGTVNIQGVAYGNGTWVAVANNGEIRYTTDPTGTWSLGTSGTTQTLLDVAYGNGYWVAVGTGSNIYYATDPAGTWTARAVAAGNSVSYGGGYWTFTGSSNIYYATDPTSTWSTLSASSTGFSSSSSITEVTYGNGYWVAGQVNSIRATTDLFTTWTPATTGLTGSTNVIEAIRYGNGYWVEVQSGGTTSSREIRYATDPAGTWSAAGPVSSQWSSGGLSLVYANGIWLAGGVSGATRFAAPLITVTRNNNSNPMYAVAMSVSAGTAETEVTGVTLEQGDQTLSEESISDGSPGTNSLRAAGVNSGLRLVNLGTTTTAADTLVAGANSTALNSIVAGTANEFTSETNYATSLTTLATTAGTGSVNSAETSSSTFGLATTMIRSGLAAGIYPADSRDWQITLNPSSIGQYEFRFKLQRLNSSGVMQTESSYGPARTGGGNDTDTISWASGTWSANDQLAVVWEHRRTDSTQNNYVISTLQLATTASGTSVASGSTQSSTFVVAQTMVRTLLPAGIFASGSQTWSITYVISAMVTPYEMRLKLQRRNSAGTVQTESSYGTTRSATGTFTDTITWDSGTWAASDQLALVWEHRRPSGTGNKSGTMTANGSSYVVAPIPPRYGTLFTTTVSKVNTPTVLGGRVNGAVRETTAGQGSRSVGFQSITSEDVAAVYLAIREKVAAAIDWIVGIPIR